MFIYVMARVKKTNFCRFFKLFDNNIGFKNPLTTVFGCCVNKQLLANHINLKGDEASMLFSQLVSASPKRPKTISDCRFNDFHFKAGFQSNSENWHQEDNRNTATWCFSVYIHIYSLGWSTVCRVSIKWTVIAIINTSHALTSNYRFHYYFSGPLVHSCITCQEDKFSHLQLETHSKI